MKKLVVLLLLTAWLLALVACDGGIEDNEYDRNLDTIEEYDGVALAKLTYITVDYNGGYTQKKVIDFKENKYYSLGYLPANNENPELELKSSFDDDQEKIFINSCYSFGLFALKEEYKTSEIIYDGGGWTLIIEYEDGTSKTSNGDNAGPTKIFDKCSTCFYDLCGEVVMGSLPQYYAYPPQISYAFYFKEGDTLSSTNETAKVVLADYNWNGKTRDSNPYLLCEENKNNSEFRKAITYTLVLYTSNYDYSKKFNKFTVKQHDFNSELTNEKVVYTGKWIKQIEIELEMNKIYVYEMSYNDGNCVQYTFSTFCNE